MRRGDLIRFVATERHEPYGHRSGVFQTAYRLCDQRRLTGSDHRELRTILDWFEQHLAKPSRFARSGRAHATGAAIAWMRASAPDYLIRLRSLVALVETTGIVVEELRTIRPGYVVYQDEHQVIALPFADTPR